jgi:hypothetical protein
MYGLLRSESTEKAKRDFENRTLAKFQGNFARLIYLASLRDYNTGEYHHEGLSQRYNIDCARRAIALCHMEIFKRLVLCPMRELVDEIDFYVRSNCSTVHEFFNTWRKLQPYKLAVPLECSRLTAEFFALNVRTGLEILESRERRGQCPLNA